MLLLSPGLLRNTITVLCVSLLGLLPGVHAAGSNSTGRTPPSPSPLWGGLRDWVDWAPEDTGPPPTQASTFTSQRGPDAEDNPGDAFNAYTTEASSVANPAGMYIDDSGDQTLALDPMVGVWGGAWAGRQQRGAAKKGRPNFRRQNPTHDGNGTSHFKLEAGTQRGQQALAGTYEGARAAAGSASSFNLAEKTSIGGAAVSSNNEASGPTPGLRTVVRNGERRSVAFTGLAPNSAAQAGTGYGTVASAAGWEVASTARSDRDSLQAERTRATIGHRPPGESNGAFDSFSGCNQRKTRPKQRSAVRSRRLLLMRWQ